MRSSKMPSPSSTTIGERRILRALALASLVAQVSPALAQPTGEDPIAWAKRRFEEGKALEDRERWKEALEAFQDVTKVKTTPQERFQIAFCEENLGHWVAALDGYAEALRLANEDPEKAKDVLKAAPERVSALEPRLPHVVVEVGGAGVHGQAGFVVLLDDQPIEAARYGQPIAVDVGRHTIDLQTTSQDGKVSTHVADVQVADGDSKSVSVDVPDVATTPAPAEPPKGTAPPTPPTSGTKVPAIVVGSVGLASLALAGVFLGLRQDAISTVRDGCTDPEHDRGCNPKLLPVAEDGQRYTYASASLAVIGAAALGTATVLWFTVGATKSAKTAPVSVVVSPWFVGAAGRF
jgi:hypothetical protein